MTSWKVAQSSGTDSLQAETVISRQASRIPTLEEENDSGYAVRAHKSAPLSTLSTTPRSRISQVKSAVPRVPSAVP